MKEKRKACILGAAFIFGLEEIKKALEKTGYEAVFIEVPYMNDYMQLDDRNLMVFQSDLSKCDGALMLPVSEYWITVLLENGCGNISQRALMASRSKKYLNELLKKNGESGVLFYSYEEACSLLEKGEELLVKPEGLYSGYGVKSVNSIEELDLALEKCRDVKTHSLKLFGINNKTPMITEKLRGSEYSADCFWNQGKMNIVRICKKQVVEIHENPCTAVIQVIPCTEKIQEALFRWNKVLFDDTDISFSQFDFIERDGELIPIDFACRVGGGMQELLKECGNPYACAIEGKSYFVPEKENGLPTQFNYLPVKSGKIKSLDFEKLSPRTKFLKKIGDFVPESPSSVASRVAVGLGYWPDITDMKKDTVQKLLLGSEYIGNWKKV